MARKRQTKYKEQLKNRDKRISPSSPALAIVQNATKRQKLETATSILRKRKHKHTYCTEEGKIRTRKRHKLILPELTKMEIEQIHKQFRPIVARPSQAMEVEEPYIPQKRHRSEDNHQRSLKSLKTQNGFSFDPLVTRRTIIA